MVLWHIGIFKNCSHHNTIVAHHVKVIHGLEWIVVLLCSIHGNMLSCEFVGNDLYNFIYITNLELGPSSELGGMVMVCPYTSGPRAERTDNIPCPLLSVSFNYLPQ